MVALSEVEAFNASASKTLPPNLVAVFAGATAGIGETSLKAFAKHTVRPRIYFIGRSQESGDRILKELKGINAEGEYSFIKADMSLLKNVDDVCRDIKRKESVINVLFSSQGTLKLGVNTTEGLPLITAVSLYSRTRLMVNLLPLIQRAPSLRRVITVMSATNEGQAYIDDPAGRNIPFSAAKGHLATILTLSLQALGPQYPNVSFIHNFPGCINTDLIRSGDGLIMQGVKYWFKLSMTVRRKWMSLYECGERHAWLCLNGRYVAKERGDAAVGDTIALGADGKPGSGVYSIGGDGESSPERVVELLEKYRAEGAVEKVWGHLESEFKRITGTISI